MFRIEVICRRTIENSKTLIIVRYYPKQGISKREERRNLKKMIEIDHLN
jgi:hypothetical protein